MNDAVILERRYRWLLRWYPRWFRDDIEDELLGVLMAGAGDGRRWPSAAEAADVLWTALRMRFWLPRPGTQSPGWTDAWAVFSVLGPVFVLLTNIVVVLVPPYFLRVHAVNWAGYTGPMPTQARWLSTDLHAPYGWKPFATALICEAILVAWVLLLSAGALVVIAGATAIRLRLGWHTLWIGAALMYPYLLEFASIASGRSIVFWPGYYSDFLGFDVTSLHMVVVLSLGPAVMAMLAVLIAARGRLASSDARLTPGT
jgi:hypothetical protein